MKHQTASKRSSSPSLLHSARVALGARSAPPLLLALLAAACQAPEARDLGLTRAEQDLREQEPLEPFYADRSEFIGRWVGTAEDPVGSTSDGRTRTYRFPSGARELTVDVRAVVDEYGDQTLAASLSFGEGAPPPPPTDPNAGYPVGLSYAALLSYDPDFSLIGDNPDGRLPPFEGFEYTAAPRGVFMNETLALPDGLLSLQFNTNEPIDPWCQLQTPYPSVSAPGSFFCYQDHGGQIDVLADGTGASCDLYGPVDTSSCQEGASLDELLECLDVGEPVASMNCDQLYLCSSGFCSCDESSCRAGDLGVGPSTLLLRRVGDDLVGLFSNTTFLNARNMKTPLGEVRFQRVD